MTEQTPRTEGPTPRADKARAELAEELIEVKEALANLTEHMDTSLPEERIKGLLLATQAEERNSRKRLRLLFAVGGFVVGVILIVGAVLLNRISDGVNEAEVTSHYVRNCLIAPPGERDPKQCGGDSSAQVVGALLKAINCSLLVLPEERTDAKLDACAAKAFTP